MRILYNLFFFFAISVADHQVQIDFIPSGQHEDQIKVNLLNNLSHLNILLPLYSVSSYGLKLRAEKIFALMSRKSCG